MLEVVGGQNKVVAVIREGGQICCIRDDGLAEGLVPVRPVVFWVSGPHGFRGEITVVERFYYAIDGTWRKATPKYVTGAANLKAGSTANNREGNIVASETTSKKISCAMSNSPQLRCVRHENS